MNDVAFKQRFQLLRIPHQIQIPCVHNGGVDGQVAFVVDDPCHHLIDLILACRVVATAAQMAVDEQNVPSEGVGHVDEDGKLLGQLRPCLHVWPDGGGDQVAILGGVPTLVPVQGKPRVKEGFDLVGARAPALAEQVNVGIQGGQDALKMGLSRGVNEAVAEHVVGADTEARWVGFGQAQRLHRRCARFVEVVNEFEPCVGQIVVELGIPKQQPDGVLRKEQAAPFEDRIASKRHFEFAAGHRGGGNQSDFRKVDLVGRAKIGVRKQAVEIDAEFRPKPLAHRITGGGVHVDVNLEEQIVRVQDVRQVEVRPQPHVDIKEVGIAADLHFHEVNRG